MADAESSIFNKKATEKLRSPDDLDKYVQVTNPSVWVILFACIALLAGLLAWGVFGSVSTSVSTMGTVVDGEAICLLSGEDASHVVVGDAANVGGVQMTVGGVSSIPISAGESKNVLQNDYLVSTLMKGDWAYVVKFDGDTSTLDQDIPISVNITTEHMAPISLILKNRS